MLSKKTKIIFYIWGVIFLILSVLRFYISYRYQAPEEFLWFCVNIMLLLALGLFLKNNLLISSVIASYIIVGTIISIDLLSFLLTNNLAFGVTTYIFTAPKTTVVLTFYHIFLLIIPLWAVWKMKSFHKNAWLISSAHFIIISLITLLTAGNINCVREACPLGIFNFLYILKPEFLLQIFFNWLALTILIFIPANLVLYKIFKKIKK